jgi:hypothetical protein
MKNVEVLSDIRKNQEDFITQQSVEMQAKDYKLISIEEELAKLSTSKFIDTKNLQL